MTTVLHRAAVFGACPWPLILILEVSPELPRWRSALFDLANDPTWHKGECCLYLSPTRLPDDTDRADPMERWRGPINGEALRDLLLDRAVIPDVGDLQTRTAAQFVEHLWDLRLTIPAPSSEDEGGLTDPLSKWEERTLRASRGRP